MRTTLLLLLLVTSHTGWSETGEQAFMERCAVCHQADGSGDEPWIPALKTLAHENDSAFLIAAMLNGQFRRGGELNGHTIPTMPSWYRMSDEEIALLVNYLRAEFGFEGGDVKAADVQSIRNATNP